MEESKMDSTKTENGVNIDKKPSIKSYNSFKHSLIYTLIYFTGIGLLFLIIAEPFTMRTYFSDNSLLPGLANREFSLGTEAEYYLKDLKKLSGITSDEKLNEKKIYKSLATSPQVVNYIKHELDNFGLEVYEQNFNYYSDVQLNGTNLYSIIRAERSTSSESMVLCIPYKITENSNTLSGVGLGLAMAKYFNYKSFWAKDLIILFVDHDHVGLSSWLDSYYDVNFRHDLKRDTNKDKLYYDSLPARSGPLQSAIIIELYGRQITHINIKIQGLYGQLPNLDLFNLVIELAARESVTPYFHNKSLPFDLTPSELYDHHLQTALSFMYTQATMQSDGLHGHFLKYSVQALTIEGPPYENIGKKSHIMTTSLLNLGRLLEGIFRSLNNLTERFNRSYYFYIILSLRRFTSIGYYMIPFGFINGALVLKALNLYRASSARDEYISKRGIVILVAAWLLSLISTFNISLSIMIAIPIVPILILFL